MPEIPIMTSGQPYEFEAVGAGSGLADLKAEWRKSLTGPQDGMWEVFRESSQHFEIRNEGHLVGYACVDDENRLLQFFLLPRWLSGEVAIFKRFIAERKITEALAGTNNPIFLSLALHHQRSVSVHTYLFQHFIEMPVPSVPGSLRAVEDRELEKMRQFYHQTVGGELVWLWQYLENLTGRGELFVLEHGGEILGTCEVRKSESNPSVADLGMVVATSHRRKGLGTYLLGKATEICFSWGRDPICSCEIDNPGSMRCIEKNGFRSIHRLLAIGF